MISSRASRKASRSRADYAPLPHVPRALTLAPKAQADLEAIRDYAAAWDNPQAEEKLRARLAAALEDLLDAPCRWPVHDHPQVREKPVGDYRIMYEVVNDTGDN